MTGDGYPYKFVTFLMRMNNIFVFFQVNDTIKEMFVEFLQIVVGLNILSSQDYGAKIMFAGEYFLKNK